MRVLAGLSALLTVVSANAVLYHRVYHPSLQNLKYLKRGIISLDPPTVFATETLVNDLKTLSDVVKELGDPSDVFYQVALVPNGDNLSTKLDYSSVKACHLHQATAETFILHLTDSEIPFAIDYTISGIPSDGSCTEGSSKISSASLLALAENIQTLNTTVLLKKPKAPPLPALRTPPALTPEGEVVQPPTQKSFLQKYWLYIVGFLLVFLLVTPEEAETPRNGGRQ